MGELDKKRFISTDLNGEKSERFQGLRRSRNLLVAPVDQDYFSGN